jgi:hypothetical protein
MYLNPPALRCCPGCGTTCGGSSRGNNISCLDDTCPRNKHRFANFSHMSSGEVVMLAGNSGYEITDCDLLGTAIIIHTGTHGASSGSPGRGRRRHCHAPVFASYAESRMEQKGAREHGRLHRAWRGQARRRATATSRGMCCGTQMPHIGSTGSRRCLVAQGDTAILHCR